MVRAKSYAPGKLKRAQPPVKAKLASDVPYRLRHGTPNEMSEPARYANEASLRKAITVNLRTIHEPWLARYNIDGLPLINEMLHELSNTTITSEHKRLQRCIDEHWNITVVYEFWKEQT